MPSSVGASRRLWEFTLLCADPTVASTFTVCCTRPERRRSRVGLSFAPLQLVSNQRLLDLGLAVGPQIGMFRSKASSSLRLGTSSHHVGAVSFARAEVLPLLVGVPAEPIGAVPPSRVWPCSWTTTALSTANSTNWCVQCFKETRNTDQS